MSKYKARFIFRDENNNLSIIKGYVQENEFDNKPRLYLYGANNISNLESSKKKHLINNGANSIEQLKELVPGLVRCIIDEKCQYDFDSNLVCKSSFSKRKRSIHISIEKWLLDEVKKLTEERIKTYENSLSDKENNFGLIQPSLSSVMSELMLEGLTKFVEEQ